MSPAFISLDIHILHRSDISILEKNAKINFALMHVLIFL